MRKRVLTQIRLGLVGWCEGQRIKCEKLTNTSANMTDFVDGFKVNGIYLPTIFSGTYGESYERALSSSLDNELTLLGIFEKMKFTCREDAMYFYKVRAFVSPS